VICDKRRKEEAMSRLSIRIAHDLLAGVTNRDRVSRETGSSIRVAKAVAAPAVAGWRRPATIRC
jgi:hypothetical protein